MKPSSVLKVLTKEADNISTAVTSILKGKEREYNKRFVQMCNHDLVKSVACTPGAGWEKGQIEKQVQDVKNWIFAPRLRFSSLEKLNQRLNNRCLETRNVRKHPIKLPRPLFQKNLEVVMIFCEI